MRARRSARRPAGLPVAVVLTGVALAAAGCSSHSDRSGAAATPSRSASPAGGQAAPGLPAGVQGLAKVPAKVPNDPALRSRVAISSCKSVGGGWQAAGTASNPGAEQKTYRITVFFTTTTATVVGAAHTTVTVKPGAEKSWSVSDHFTAPKQALCVLRGVG